LATEKELSDFLAKAETKAFKRTAYLTKDDEAALDIVQDSMFKLIEKYSNKPVAELPFLFQKILSNMTMDWFRKRKTEQNVILSSDFFSDSDEDNDSIDILENIADVEQNSDSFSVLNQKETLHIIEEAIHTLPARQQEAFMLRYWEDMSVSETAQIMNCSEGSVKTHCSRATQALAQILKNKGISL
jgi:RNA polymerase sigma-70 factor, ECF subfamily